MAINYEADKQMEAELLLYMSDDKRNIAIFHVLTIPRIFLKAHTVFR